MTFFLYSLHFLNPHTWNEYQYAIHGVGSILEAYDADKMIPVYGFGGIPPNAPEVDHCFPLNLNSSNPEVYGVQGVLNLYTASVAHIRLHGPTCFAPYDLVFFVGWYLMVDCRLIHQTIAIAASSTDPQKQKYFVLMIATDGIITDIQQTIDAIVTASHTAPLSVGVSCF